MNFAPGLCVSQLYGVSHFGATIEKINLPQQTFLKSLDAIFLPAQYIRVDLGKYPHMPKLAHLNVNHCHAFDLSNKHTNLTNFLNSTAFGNSGDDARPDLFFDMCLTYKTPDYCQFTRTTVDGKVDYQINAPYVALNGSSDDQFQPAPLSPSIIQQYDEEKLVSAYFNCTAHAVDARFVYPTPVSWKNKGVYQPESTDFVDSDLCLRSREENIAIAFQKTYSDPSGMSYDLLQLQYDIQRAAANDLTISGAERLSIWTKIWQYIGGSAPPLQDLKHYIQDLLNKKSFTNAIAEIYQEDMQAPEKLDVFFQWHYPNAFGVQNFTSAITAIGNDRNLSDDVEEKYDIIIIYNLF